LLQADAIATLGIVTDSPVRIGPRIVESPAPSDPRPSRVSLVDGLNVGHKYKLIKRLGEGGMAEVWRAHDATLDVDVAIKFIRADLEQGELGDRLLQEARAAARLGHPAIVRVHDYGKSASGDPYIAMELLEGETLSAVLDQRGRIPASRAVKTLLPIAHALATAHDKGIVHRDLKPDNVFLIPSDELIQPKLVDFGIAKLDRSEARITRMGTAMGSPGYMSPEQARGEDVDHRSDIWAFCVMLYEAVTGRLPFEAKSYNALLRSIIEDEPPSIRTFAAGDDALWAILVRGLEKDPSKRWSSMRALGHALAGWLLDRGVTEDVAGASLQATWIARTTPSASSPPIDPAAAMSRVQNASTVMGSAPVLPAATPAAPPAAGRRLALFGAVGVVALVVLIVVVVALLGSKKPNAPPTQADVSPTPTIVPAPEQPTVSKPSTVVTPTEATTAPSSTAKAPEPAKTRGPRPGPAPKKAEPKKTEEKPKPDSFQLKTPF
jgi:serine/threonine-protein kinase